MSILKKTNYTVKAEGSMVNLQFGNIPISMDYNTALQLAQFLRISGREAKANAGDRSMLVRAHGVITDAESDERKRQSMFDPTASFVGA